MCCFCTCLDPTAQTKREGVNAGLTGCKVRSDAEIETLGGSGKECRKLSFSKCEHFLRFLSWRTTGRVTSRRDQTGLWSESMMFMHESYPVASTVIASTLPT